MPVRHGDISVHLVVIGFARLVQEELLMVMHRFDCLSESLDHGPVGPRHFDEFDEWRVSGGFFWHLVPFPFG